VFDTQRAGSLLAAYVDDLSNWYVRRSRRRFWAGDPSALATLHECVYVVTLLMAPLTPFITERVWQDMFAATSDQLPESVHLAAWPRVDGSLVDDELSAQMSLTRRLVELGRAARADAKVRIRQPLRRALVASSAWSRLTDELRQEVADELNVLAVEPLSSAGADLVDFSAKGNFRALGRRFGKQTPVVANAIAAADATRLAADLAEHGRATVTVEGEDVEVLADEVIVSERPREGWSVVNEQGETVALDLEITDELRLLGLARGVVRRVQEARKTSGFDVSDRIRLRWVAEGETAEAIELHGGTVAEEVLAPAGPERAGSVTDLDGGAPETDEELGLTFTVERVATPA
jgi:isoleucyl-tRNA synthetase